MEIICINVCNACTVDIKKDMKYINKIDLYIPVRDNVLNVSHVSNLCAPNNVIITEHMNNIFTDEIPYIVKTNITDSLLKWTLITEYVPIDNNYDKKCNPDAMVGIVMKCEPTLCNCVIMWR